MTYRMGRKPFKITAHALDAMQSDTINGANAYLKAHGFIEELKRCQRNMPSDTVLNLKRLALSGDIEGAYKGLRLAIGGTM